MKTFSQVDNDLQNEIVDGINIFEKFNGFERVLEWRRIYHKPKSKWVTKDEENFANCLKAPRPGLEPESHP